MPMIADDDFEPTDVDSVYVDVDADADFDPDLAEAAAARDAFEADVDTDSEVADPVEFEIVAGTAPERRSDRVVDDRETADASQDDPRLLELAAPYVGRWNRLISTTNWEKGAIITAWRQTLLESGASATEYSDEVWARRVGGVTAPHVGRLRRVFDRFGTTHTTYAGIYWTHFLAALDWDDAALWLEGASQEGWSVSAMREMRWQANGAVDSQRPTNSRVVDVDLDEDVVMPAQGGGRQRPYEDLPAAAPYFEGPDFGDEDSLSPAADMRAGGGVSAKAAVGGGAAESDGDDAAADDPGLPVQPFAGLPRLPDDLENAIEQLKLAVLRHKTSQWSAVDIDTVQRYLDALGILIRA